MTSPSVSLLHKPWRLIWPLFFLLFLAYLQALPTFPDPDSWYHLKLAMIEKESGLPRTFPALPYTILAQNFVDHHLLYHLLLIPFLYFLSPFAAIKIFTLVSALAVLAVLTALAKKYAPNYAALLPLFLISVPAWLFRLNLAKASSLGIICFILLLHFWWQKNKPGLFLTAFFYALLYNGWVVGFLAVTILATYKKFLHPFTLPSIPSHRVRGITNWLSTVVGFLLALILNPYFPQNLVFAWRHIVGTGFYHTFVGGQSGNEWFGLGLENGFGALGTFGLLLLPAVIIAIVRHQELSKIAREAWLLSSVFFLGAIFSQRLIEFFVPLVILAALMALQETFPDPKQFWQTAKNILQKFLAHRPLLTRPLIMALVFLFVFRVSLSLVSLTNEFREAWPLTYGREAGEWLSKNAPPGTLVINDDFGLFPPLWFWTRSISFLHGLDPAFSLADKPIPDSQLILLTTKQIEKLRQHRSSGWRVKYFDQDFVLLSPPYGI